MENASGARSRRQARGHDAPACAGMHDLGRHWRLVDAVGRRPEIARACSATPRRPKPCSRASPSCRSRDSHVGFDKPANPHAIDTLKEAIGKVKALPTKPSFMIHTGDITHLSKADAVRQCRADHRQRRPRRALCARASTTSSTKAQGKAYLDRYGKGTKGAGWYSFDQNGVHFIGLVNVVNLKAGGLGNLGADQLAWLADDLKGLSASHPDRRLRPHPAVDGLSAMGLGHRRQRPGARAAQAASAR